MRSRPIQQFVLTVTVGIYALCSAPAWASPDIQRISSYLTGLSAVDRDGNIYFAGSTMSLNLPVSADAFQKAAVASICGRILGPRGPNGTRGPDITTPCQHAYVIKIDPTGTSVLYATYLGGSLAESVISLQVDDDGNAYVSGSTSSQDFPVTSGAYMTAPPDGSSSSGFLTKLNARGSGLVFSTRLPGFGRIWLNEDREVLIAGGTVEATFPTTLGAIQSRRYLGHSDLFVLKLDATGSNLLFSTLLGGTYAEGLTALMLDLEGNIYLGGITASTHSIAARIRPSDFSPFPTTPAAYVNMKGGVDLFIAKLNPTATELIFSSVLGGSGDDSGLNALTLDEAGNIYFSGSTYYSPDFPVTPNAIQKTYGGGLVGELSADGSQLLYSTYIGARRGDSACCIRLDDHGNMVIQGSVSKPSFTTTPDAAQPCYPQRTANSSSPVPFLAIISADGSALKYSTYAEGQLRVLARDRTGGSYVLSEGQIVRIEAPASTQPVAEKGVRCIINAASLRQGPIAPGEVIQIIGFGVGPDVPATAEPDESGVMPKELAGVRVSIGGLPAPLLFVSKGRVTAVAPFGIAGTTQATVEVHTEWGDLAPFTVEVTPAAPALFAIFGPDRDLAEAINEDGTVHSYENPAMPGSLVRLFATGLGAMEPSPRDGATSNDSTSKHIAPISLGFNEEVISIQNAPGRVAGIIEIIIRIPTNASAGFRSYSIRAGSDSPHWSNTVSLFVSQR